MICIISGSTRKKSQSSKVGDYIKGIIGNDFGESVDRVDMSKISLPAFDDGLWERGYHWDNNWGDLSVRLKQAHGFVIITPEWDGMVPASLKNMFNLCCDGELYHKPALLVSVSSGNGGSYPITELRMSSYKNSKICYLPEHTIIRNVNETLNGENSENEKALINQLKYQLRILLAYTKALRDIRESNILNRGEYPYGD